MARRLVAFALLCAFGAACTTVSVPDPREDVVVHPAPAPHPGVYVALKTTGEPVDFAPLIAKYGEFSDVSPEAGLYPVGIRISQQTRNTNNVIYALLMACACGGTLALIPCVSTTAQDTSFQLVVGDEVVREYTHTVPYTTVVSWFVPSTHTNTWKYANEQAASDSVASFIDQLRADPKAQQFFREYEASRAPLAQPTSSGAP